MSRRNGVSRDLLAETNIVLYAYKPGAESNKNCTQCTYCMRAGVFLISDYYSRAGPRRRPLATSDANIN